MKESIQRTLVRPLLANFGSSGKKPSHRACLRDAGLAIAQVIADGRVPLEVVKRDLEDLRETIDFAIGIVSLGVDDKRLN